jgi:CHAD domain-containing protein
MAEGKWITGLHPSTSVAEAAHRVLGTRLEVVEGCRELALREAEQDVEHVHRLRVSSRRAGAALRIFGSCLPEKIFRGARRRLRDLRRSAGDARDWDVFLAGLAARQRRGRASAGVDFLVGYAVGQRAAAQKRLEAASPESTPEFERFVCEVTAAVGDPCPGSGSLMELARPLLSDLLEELHQSAGEGPTDYEHLHRVRIVGKRLRYAMEVFVDCFPPAFRDTIYPAVEEMQDILGRANDSRVAVRRLTKLRDALKVSRPDDWQRFRPDVEGVLQYHRQRLPRERRRFLEWWKHFREAGTEAALVNIIQVSSGEELREGTAG